jgi:3-oxoacyl-[acyl-carrier protein] reductase
MTRTWSKELARIGIRSNAVAPGFIDTDSTASSLSSSILDRIKASTPLRRLGNPIEVAQAVQALIENEFLNGVVLDVNGGIAI